MEKMCGVAFTSSEQHVEMREARIKRDSSDSKKLIEWFMQHYPFPDVPEILSLSTGVVGDSSINCHMAKEIVLLAIDRIVGGEMCIRDSADSDQSGDVVGALEGKVPNRP